MEISDRFVRKFRRMLASLATSECTLCVEPARFVGFWTPSPEVQARLLAPWGMTRMIAYSLCRDCREKPDCPVLIEEKILAEFEPGNLPGDVN